MLIKIAASDVTRGFTPAGKLADAELHFTDGPLAGLKLIGFGIWERRDRVSVNVTFPARQYQVNGERRSFALLRPIGDVGPQNVLRDAIIAAYRAFVNGEDAPATAPATAMPTRLDRFETPKTVSNEEYEKACAKAAADSDTTVDVGF